MKGKITVGVEHVVGPDCEVLLVVIIHSHELRISPYVPQRVNSSLAERKLPS